jgi:uncharacterized membrane protein YGL010W
MAGILDWESHAADYARYHAHPKNRACHAVGIPLIMLWVVRATQNPDVSLFPAAIVVLPLYAAWDPTLALLMAAVLFLMALAAPMLSWPVVWGLFILGWIFQFVGHAVYEKKSPAFAKNLLHLLVGPLWVLRELSGLSPK